MGSRAAYARLDHADDARDALTAEEAAFIAARDGFYQATVSETGWPYVQFRGGPVGFLKVLDAKTLGYADDRASLILMDYAHRRRLKILGRARVVEPGEDPALVARLTLPDYPARVQRAVIITVEAFDWNCPQHITPRFTAAELEAAAARDA